MRKPSSLLLAGAMAFGLTAASAAVTAFTIGTVEEVPGTDSASKVIATGSCTGTYNVDFTQNEFGFTIGGTATRVAPDPAEDPEDANARFCQDQQAKVLLTASTGTAVWYGETEANGDVIFTFDGGGVIAGAGDQVAITIGPEAGFSAPD